MRAHSPFRSGAVVQSLLLAVLASCAQGSRSSPSGPGELDEWEPERDYQPLADFARFQFLVGLSVAQRADRPAWKQGDYFQRFASTGSKTPPTLQ
jgi:hypothetical protein